MSPKVYLIKVCTLGTGVETRGLESLAIWNRTGTKCCYEMSLPGPFPGLTTTGFILRITLQSPEFGGTCSATGKLTWFMVMTPDISSCHSILSPIPHHQKLNSPCLPSIGPFYWALGYGVPYTPIVYTTPVCMWCSKAGVAKLSWQVEGEGEREDGGEVLLNST